MMLIMLIYHPQKKKNVQPVVGMKMKDAGWLKELLIPTDGAIFGEQRNSVNNFIPDHIGNSPSLF